MSMTLGRGALQIVLPIKPSSFLTISLVASSFGIAGSLMSTMLLFLGKIGPDVTMLSAMQTLGFPVVSLAIVAYWFHEPQCRVSVRGIWRGTPNWIIAALAVLLGTALCGQTALIIVKMALNRAVTMTHYLPIISVMFYSVAWAVSYVLRIRTHASPVRN